MRKKIVAGNWKMNKTPEETIMYFERLKLLVSDCKNEIILFVPYLDIFAALKYTDGTNIKIGTQNMCNKESGAYTGEISAQMLSAVGIDEVIIGHSERRQYYNETDESVNEKLKLAYNYNIRPTLCVGETIEQRNKGLTNSVLEQQITKDLKDITNEQISNTIIAYEPIWAIGTGVTASCDDANNATKYIRSLIKQLYNEEISENIVIQYGGSVKSSNSKELFNMTDIDGGLVGGASLNPDDFSIICNS